MVQQKYRLPYLEHVLRAAVARIMFFLTALICCRVNDTSSDDDVVTPPLADTPSDDDVVTPPLAGK